MVDPDELMKEIQERRRGSSYLIFKRILWLVIGIRLRAFKRRLMDRCRKCGLRLIYYRTHDDRKIKVCEYCDRVDPDNIVVEEDILPGGITVKRKVYATG